MARLAFAVSTVLAREQGLGTCLNRTYSPQPTGTCPDCGHWQWTLLSVWPSFAQEPSQKEELTLVHTHSDLLGPASISHNA